MAALTSTSPPPPVDNSRLSTFWKRVKGKSPGGTSASGPCSEPGPSRDSSVSSGLAPRASRKVVPGLPRVKTFRRQQSEDRKKLEPILPTSAERRAVSVDRRMQFQRSASRSGQLLPRASAPDFFDGPNLSVDEVTSISPTAAATHGPVDENRFLGLGGIDAPGIVRGYDRTDEQPSAYPDAISIADTQSINASQYDALVREELERKWILNLSMHFRDKSRREKFFVTYRENDSTWRRVTISLDYRDAPRDSLERDLLATKFQRDKSAKIYEHIRESLQDIQFYDTVTNLKLQTADGRLHVHVVEDVTEIIEFPLVRLVQHMECRRVRESELQFDSHMSGFVYKVRVDGHTLIKKEIPGPDTVDEFLYEVNALDSLGFSRSIIGFYGVVVDEEDQIVKGLLISYAEKGALIDIIYDSNEHDRELSWTVREKWARQIVQGLSDIHETGFVQGDFTLSNIVIDSFGNAKIIDINRRGCPVGWEPPEAAPLIESNQRISMYIGVKSDLYQLGMVLWALAAMDDEPEHQRRPLRLPPDLDVPSWYREIVEICLQRDPRARLHATTLLSKFPEASHDDMHEDLGVPSIAVHDGTSFGGRGAHENYGLSDIRTGGPWDNWQYPSISNTQATSPSFSDEPYYPPRGRSPPRPLPTHHDLYTSPYVSGNAAWAKVHDKAVEDDDPAVDEARIGISGDLQSTTCYDGMVEELDQMVANLNAGAVLEDEQAQAPDGDSPAKNISLETVVEPREVGVDPNGDTVLPHEDESEISTPAYDLTPSGSQDGAETSGKIIQDYTDDSSADGRSWKSALDHGSPARSTTSSTAPRETETQIEDSGAAYTYDRTGGTKGDMSTRPSEATGMTMSDLAPRKASLPTELPDRTSEDAKEDLPVYSDKCPDAPATQIVGGTGVAA